MRIEYAKHHASKKVLAVAGEKVAAANAATAIRKDRMERLRKVNMDLVAKLRRTEHERDAFERRVVELEKRLYPMVEVDMGQDPVVAP